MYTDNLAHVFSKSKCRVKALYIFPGLYVMIKSYYLYIIYLVKSAPPR